MQAAWGKGMSGSMVGGDIWRKGEVFDSGFELYVVRRGEMKMLEEEGDEGRLENSKLSCFWRYCDWFNGNYLCIYLPDPISSWG